MGATYQPPQWLVPNMGPGNVNKVGNYSFQFDGVGDYINIDPSITIGDNFTLSAWVKNAGDIGADDYGYIFGSGVYGFAISQGGTACGLSTGMLYYYGGPACGENLSTTVLTADTWYHIALVCDKTVGSFGQVKLYINGSLDTTTVLSTPSDLNSFSSLDTFGRNNAWNWAGNLSELTVFNYELTLSDVQDLYGDATAGVGNPMELDVVPVAYYKGDRAAFGDQWAVPNQGVPHNYALAFSGDYVTTPPWNGYQGIRASSTAVSSSHITLSCWFRNTNATHNCYLWGSHVGSNNGMYLSSSGGFYIFAAAGGGVYRYWWPTNVTANILDGNWYHIMLYIPNSTAPALWDPVNAKWYVNSVELTNTGSVSWPQGSNEVTAIKGFSYSNHSGGCEISNWAYWLSDQRANRGLIYNGGTPGDLSPLSPDVWWKLDADNVTIGSQVDVADSSGNGVTGDGPLMSDLTFPKLVDADVNAAGRSLIPNYSFSFDGIDDSIDLGTDSSLDVFGGNFSVSLWFNTTISAGTLGLMEIASFTTKFSITTGSNLNTGMGFGIGGVWDYNIGSGLTDGNWHHMVVTNTGGTYKAYIDGADTAYSTGTITHGVDNLIGIARETWRGAWFDGNLSNVAIWNSTLSAANIITLYNNGRPGDLSSFSPAPVSWWKLGNDAFATAASPTAWTIPDQIGSNDGTSQGNPTISGEAPGSTANGLSVSMDIEDRIGESGQSSNNAQSYNMATGARIAYT